MFIDYLVNWGFLSSKDLTYTGSESRGMAELPGAGDRPGKDSQPYSLPDLLPFAWATINTEGGYLDATSSLDWQTTLMKPRDGVGAIYTEGFAKALGNRVKLNCPVKEIRQTPDQVRIVYTDLTTGKDEQITADYCVCNIPLSVLMKIPADFSPEMKTAIQPGRAGAKGVKGIYPALAGDPFVTLADPKPMISTVLNGRGGMPRFAGTYTDEEIAAVVSYVRGSFGNHASAVTPQQVHEVREAQAASPVSSPEANMGINAQSTVAPNATPATPAQ